MQKSCCKSNTRTCTDCVWEDFSKQLKNFINKRVSSEQDAEDLLHEVFIKIHNNIHTVLDDNKIYAWIYRIARNSITDYYRRNRNTYAITELTEDIESTTDEDLSANTEIALYLKDLVNHLPEIYRQAILSTEFQNMTQKELSEKLGLSISTVKSRVQRARKMLKDMVLTCCEIEIDRRGNIIDYKRNNN